MGLLDPQFWQSPQGIGLLSGVASYAANARRGAPVNSLGRGLAGGLAGYGLAQDQIRQAEQDKINNELRQFQLQQARDAIAAAQKTRDWRAKLPEMMKPVTTPEQAVFEQPPLLDSGMNPLGQGAPMLSAGGAMTAYKPATTAPNPALRDFLMADGSPYADKVIEQQLFPKERKVKDWQKVTVDGRVLYAPYFEDGSVGQPVPYDVAEKLNFQDTGGAVVGLNPFTGQPVGGSVPKSMTPGERARIGLDRERFNFDKGTAVAEAGGPNQIAYTKQFGKAPAGFRWKQDGSLESIPGGPNDIKAGLEGQKAEQRKTAATTAAQNVLTAVTDARDLVGLSTAGAGSLMAKVPGSDARNLQAKLETIKANLGFDRLQQMRDMSPTGGALGQVAVQELIALQSTVASLDQAQSPAQLKAALDKIEMHYNNWLGTLGNNAGGASGSWSIKRKP